jgi:hypothetical protein
MEPTECQFQRVKQLVARGLSDYKIAALTAVSRSTVPRWHHRDEPPEIELAAARARDWSVPDPAGDSTAILEALVGPKR